MPGSHVLAADAGGLLVLLLAVAGFAVVMIVVVVILALIQAILPGGDTEADKLHAAEQAREVEDADLRSDPPVG